VSSGAHVSEGAVLSSTDIVRLQVDELLQSSVAVQVLVTLYSAAQLPADVTSDEVIDTLASHASVAVALPKLGDAGHSIGDVTAGHVIVGGVMSCTTIVRLQVDELLQSSVAVQVRVTLYVLPQPGVVTSDEVIATLASHASVALALPKFGALGQSIGDVTVGHVIVGGVMSTTAIVRLQVDELLQSSVAVQVLVTL